MDTLQKQDLAKRNPFFFGSSKGFLFEIPRFGESFLRGLKDEIQIVEECNPIGVIRPVCSGGQVGWTTQRQSTKAKASFIG